MQITCKKQLLQPKSNTKCISYVWHHIHNVITQHVQDLFNIRGNVKMSMSDRKLNSLSFLFNPNLPFKTKVTKKFCNVSVNTQPR